MIIPAEKITEIKQAANIVDVVGDLVALKQTGKDYIGSCPFHDEEKPSFTVSPAKKMYYCFGCGASGDVLGFVMKKAGISFIDAARRLAARYSIDLPSDTGAPAVYRGTPRPPRSTLSASAVTKNSKSGKESAPLVSPSELWQEKAGKFAAWAYEKLLENTDQLQKLADRGIQIKTVEKFQLGWNPGKNGKDLFRPRESWGLPTEMKKERKKKMWLPIGLVIPMFAGKQVHRLRIRRPDGCDPPTYYIIPGSSMATWIIQESSAIYVIVESELDGILLWQEVRDVTGIIPTGSSQSRPDQTATEKLRKSARILNALDFDTAGANALAWWHTAFSQSMRWPVPAGKDPGEAWIAGIRLRSWIISAFPSGWLMGQSILGSKKKTPKPPEDSLCDVNAIGENVGQGENKVQPDSPSGSLSVSLVSEPVKDIKKLERLLKQYPVTIYNSPERIYLRYPHRWAAQNWKISKKISDLIFLAPDIFDYICTNPARIINANNLIFRK